MAAASVVHLSIASTWDGHEISDHEITRIDARLDGTDLVVRVDAPFGGDPAPVGPPGARWQLWEHEVVELFLLGAADRYLEIELGPHGHHLVLQLEGRRNIVRREIPIEYTARVLAERWVGHARIPRTLLPTGPLRANAFRAQGGNHFAHASVAPVLDFHQLDRFVPVELGADGG